MQHRNPKRLLPPVLAIVLLTMGVALGIWLMMKAHDFYYPQVSNRMIQGADSTFTAKEAGRYEITHPDGLGDLKIEVHSVKTGDEVPVDEFTFVEQLFHTQGWQGYALQIDSPGEYRLSVQPWPTGAHVYINYTNTLAIAIWTLAGIGLICLCLCVAAGLLLLKMRRQR